MEREHAVRGRDPARRRPGGGAAAAALILAVGAAAAPVAVTHAATEPGASPAPDRLWDAYPAASARSRRPPPRVMAAPAANATAAPERARSPSSAPAALTMTLGALTLALALAMAAVAVPRLRRARAPATAPAPSPATARPPPPRPPPPAPRASVAPPPRAPAGTPEQPAARAPTPAPPAPDPPVPPPAEAMRRRNQEVYDAAYSQQVRRLEALRNMIGGHVDARGPAQWALGERHFTPSAHVPVRPATWGEANCRIVLVRPGEGRAQFRAVAAGPAGEGRGVGESHAFTWAAARPLRPQGEALAAHTSLVRALLRAGWRPERPGEVWSIEWSASGGAVAPSAGGAARERGD